MGEGEVVPDDLRRLKDLVVGSGIEFADRGTEARALPSC
jgi:hypothetical protein